MRVPVRALGALALILWIYSAAAVAQIGPARAHPIAATAPHDKGRKVNGQDSAMPIMSGGNFTAVIDLVVGSDGVPIEATLVQRSGSNIYDERVRGYWKKVRFLPARDDEGRPREDTLRITHNFVSEAATNTTAGKVSHDFSIEGVKPADSVPILVRMSCRDMLVDYDFMKGFARKADLSHEQLFTTSFAMFIAKHNLDEAARIALITHWKPTIEQVVEGCRADPGAQFLNGVFEGTLLKSIAAPQKTSR